MAIIRANCHKLTDIDVPVPKVRKPASRPRSSRSSPATDRAGRVSHRQFLLVSLELLCLPAGL